MKRALLYILMPIICVVVCLGTVFSFSNNRDLTETYAAETASSIKPVWTIDENKVYETTGAISSTNPIPTGSYPTMTSGTKVTFSNTLTSNGTGALYMETANMTGISRVGYQLFHADITVPVGATVKIKYSFAHTARKTCTATTDAPAGVAVLIDLGEDKSVLDTCTFTQFGMPAVGTNLTEFFTNNPRQEVMYSNDLVLTYTNETSAPKTFTNYFITAICARVGSNPIGFTNTVTVGSSVTEYFINKPEDVTVTYDGTGKWLDNLSESWIEELHRDSTEVSVVSIAYEDTEGNPSSYGTDTTKIVNAGEYTITISTDNYKRWSDETIEDKTFKITIKQKEVGTLIPNVASGTYYAGIGTDEFPEITLPAAFAGKGTIEWDAGQTLGETGNYNWTYTPTDKNYAVKTGSSPITVKQIEVGSITANYTGTGDIYTSTNPADLIKYLEVHQTNNDGSDGGLADLSNVKFKEGTTLKAGDNTLTVQLISDTNISCTVTVPNVLAVKPASLIVTHNGDPVYHSTTEATLKTQLTVKVKNNDGTVPKTLTASEYSLPENLELTDGTFNLEVTYKFGEGADETVRGSVTLSVSAAEVDYVDILNVTIPDSVKLWEGDAASVLKKYITVEVTFNDTDKTKKTLDPEKDAYTVKVKKGNGNELVAGTFNFTVTYGGVESLPKTASALAIVVTEIIPSYDQTGIELYSSAKLEDLQIATQLSVYAKFNNEKGGALDPSDYTVTLPENFSSTNNQVTVAWKKDPTKKATFEVEVTDVVPDTVATTVSDGAKFNASNKLDDLKAGLTVILTNNDGSTKTLTADEYTLDIAESEKHNDGCLCAGERTVTVKYSDSITTTVTVTVDKAEKNMSGVKFEDKTVSFDDTAHKFEITGALPEGVSVEYEYNGSTQTNPFEFTAVNESGYVVTAKFKLADTDNYKAIADKSATLIISAKPVHDMTGVEIEPTPDGGSGLQPDGNGGYTGKYGEGGGFEVDVKPEDLPEGVTAGEPVIKKLKEDGNPANPADWEVVPEIDGAGDYEVSIQFGGGEGYAPIPDMTVPVHIDKGDHDMGGVEFKPTASDGGSAATGGLQPAAGGGFTGTYSPDGGLDIEIPTADLPEGVTPQAPVYKKLKDGGDPAKPEDWEVVPEIDGAGEYTVEIGFGTDGENYNPIEPIKTTVSVSKADYDMSGVTFEDKTVIQNGTAYTLEIGGTLPTGVSVTYAVKDQSGTSFTAAGTYEFTASFTNPDSANYNDIAPKTAKLIISDSQIDSLTVTTDKGAEFDIENTLADVLAKIKVTANLNNGLTEELSKDNIKLENGNLREGEKLEIGEQTILVTYTDEDGKPTTATYVINVAKHKLALPVYSGNYAYTSNAITPKVKDFTGYDSALMTYVTEKVQSGTKAGTYRAVFALNDGTYYEWASGTSGKVSAMRYAIALDEEVLPELVEGEAAVNWNIAKAKIAASWKSGENPTFMSESYKGSFGDVVGLKYYTDETMQTEIDAGSLQAGGNYFVVAGLLDDENFELEESAETIMDKPLAYTQPESALVVFFKTNWLWFAIGLAVLLLIVAIILGVIASRKRKAKAEKREAEERRAREEERRLEREERMARMQMPQMQMPQYMPQMPMPMPMPQYAAAQPASGGSSDSMAEIATLKAEISALRAEQSSTKEIAALRNEMSAMRNDITYAKRGAEPRNVVPSGIYTNELSELIAAAVKSAVVGVMSKETKISKAAEANKAKVVKTEVAQPVSAIYPPDAVTTTVTTTRVDTTKKNNAQPTARTAENRRDNLDGMVFDVNGFYNPASERDLASLDRTPTERNARNDRRAPNRNRNGRSERS